MAAKTFGRKWAILNFSFKLASSFKTIPMWWNCLFNTYSTKPWGMDASIWWTLIVARGSLLSAAKHFQSVYGVEISSLSVDAAQNNAKRNYINHVKFVKGDAKTIFSKLKKVPPRETVVIVDPPRKGCDTSFMNQLLAFKPRKIVYISCEPTTQARDAKRIVQEGGYKITDVTPFDMFPQTRHIENVITFVLP